MPQPLAEPCCGLPSGGERVMVARLLGYDDPETGSAVVGVV
ncbi:hypothetical protein ACFYPX_08290 [Micromonospora zamorensis]